MTCVVASTDRIQLCTVHRRRLGPWSSLTRRRRASLRCWKAVAAIDDGYRRRRAAVRLARAGRTRGASASFDVDLRAITGETPTASRAAPEMKHEIDLELGQHALEQRAARGSTRSPHGAFLARSGSSGARSTVTMNATRRPPADE